MIRWLQANYSKLYKAVLFLVSIFIIVQLFPRQAGFEYEYHKARPWLYNDLMAPFDFAILKTQEELEAQREAVREEFRPFFMRDTVIATRQLNAFEASFRENFPEYASENELPAQNMERVLKTSLQILDSLFSTGIISIEERFQEEPSSFEIRVVEGQVASTHRLADFLTITAAYQRATQMMQQMDEQYHPFVEPLLGMALAPNIIYDEEMSNLALETRLESIPVTRGMVQQGEKIISQGELITPEKYQILESFKAEYTRQRGQAGMQNLQFAGQLILVSITMVVLAMFLFVFRRDVFQNNRQILLILLSIVIMILTTSLVVRYNVDWLYLLPISIVPIVIRAFFDNRLALYVHIITIILIGFLIPRSFEFVFLQFLAGIIAIMSMASLRRRSQLLITVGLIFLTYSAVFFGWSLSQTGSFDDLEWINFGYFAGGATLTLFAYPLIYLFERLFGMPTDFSLLELADTNNKLLRELSLQAPGTFQHSLQVSNLSEEAIYAIGGNALLARTGALYHDIGKMDDPIYFTENQASGMNPHDDISYEESARIIINHVLGGIEKARRHNIPEYIIDFIRTHHGTTTARYFYTMRQKQNPGEEIDPAAFTYPGPRPFSKETAVVMMADSVEAASRSLKKPDENSINELVETILDNLIGEKQFDKADITFQDITTIKKIFKRRLMNISHVRVAYPKMN